jgi:hypothetical protein
VIGTLLPVRQATTQCGWLTAWTAVSWLLLSVPAYKWAGTLGLEGLSYAALLSLVPGWLVLSCVALTGNSRSQAMATLAGTVVRMLFVLLGVLVLRISRPDLGLKEFQGWVVAFYFITLFVETIFLVRTNSQGVSLSNVAGGKVNECSEVSYVSPELGGARHVGRPRYLSSRSRLSVL